MKNHFLPLLSFVLSIGFVFSASAHQPRPHVNAKRAFAHTSEAGDGKANKARFRRENNIRPTIDLNPHSLEKTKTVKATHHYKFAKAR